MLPSGPRGLEEERHFPPASIFRKPSSEPDIFSLKMFSFLNTLDYIRPDS